ncbi:membrane protein [Pilimelia terevasa]|uniref:Membrane protein n=1 Tax=Pilimelia terevasa TaxID=53372 RepID=A0A8J3FLP9_9ACTN|nr:pilus assembly protein TadG-related protein [Pilimelia terevasa]GGK36798.1 membrane protein [Pilimelia terevasa]
MTRRRLADIGDDRGGVSVFVAMLAPVLLLLVGLVVDGAGQVRALQRADNVAAQAARTAGQAIDLPAAVAGGVKRIDPAAANEAASRYLLRAGATGTATVAPDRQSVTVTATISHQPLLLGAFGYGSRDITGEATARILTPN